MASRKTIEDQIQTGHEPIVAAAEKASLIIRDLQSRLRRRPVEMEESPEELERQLEEYFASSGPPAADTRLLGELRQRVVDGVVDRILLHWDQNTPLENDVMDRLIERLLKRLEA